MKPIKILAALATIMVAAFVIPGCGGSSDPDAQARHDALAITQDIRTAMPNVPDAATFEAKTLDWGKRLGDVYRESHGKLKSAVAELGRAIEQAYIAVSMGTENENGQVAADIGNAVRAVASAARSG